MIKMISLKSKVPELNTLERQIPQDNLFLVLSDDNEYVLVKKNRSAKTTNKEFSTFKRIMENELGLIVKKNKSYYLDVKRKVYLITKGTDENGAYWVKLHTVGGVDYAVKSSKQQPIKESLNQNFEVIYCDNQPK